jgi:hypothetical protein
LKKALIHRGDVEIAEKTEDRRQKSECGMKNGKGHPVALPFRFPRFAFFLRAL